MSATGFELTPRASFMGTLPLVQSEQPLDAPGRAQSELEVSSARLRLLLDLTNSMVATGDLNDVLREVTIGARRVMRSDFAMLALLDSEGGRLHVNAFDLPDATMLDQEALDSLAEALGGRVFPSGKPWTGNSNELAQTGMQADPQWVMFQSCCALPLVTRDGILGILALSKREEIDYSQDELDFLMQVSSQVAIAVERSLVQSELQKAQGKCWRGEDSPRR
jgi:formate hydrogenlyase transcriptional activator